MGNSNENEAFRRMTKLVNYLLSRADSGPFREPVDYRGLGLWDYPKIIKKVRTPQLIMVKQFASTKVKGPNLDAILKYLNCFSNSYR